jgi:hypothetical protein
VCGVLPEKKKQREQKENRTTTTDRSVFDGVQPQWIEGCRELKTKEKKDGTKMKLKKRRESAMSCGWQNVR